MKILLVEDNEGDILLTQEALLDSNPETEIKVMRDGESAVDCIFKRGRFSEVETPDLILLDINLPKKNGHDVLREIKASDQYGYIPIVLLTTSSADQDIQKGYRNGANAYVVKDFVYEDLTFMVTEIEKFWRQVAMLPKSDYA